MQRGAEVLPFAAHGDSARAVIRTLLVHGPMPRAELARRLRLSPAALTKLTRELIDSTAIRASDALVGGTGGRPGMPLEVALEEHQMVGVKVTAGVAYGVRTDAGGTILLRSRRSLASTEVASVLAAIVDLVNELAADAPVEALGVGLAGAMSRFDDRVRQNLYLGWDDVPLATELERLSGLPTVISNDVRALTAGVHWSGPARGTDDFAVLTTGVGIGLGLVIERQTIAGAGGRSGMIGHQRISDAGPLCSEGHRGCADAYLTTAAITGAVAVAHGDPAMTLERVCELADEADAAAGRVLADAGWALGVIIARLINELDLPMVILAGDGLPAITRARPDLERALAEHLDRHATPPVIELLVSDFDEWARGAAVVACQWLLLQTRSAARATGHHRGRGSTRPPRPDRRDAVGV